MSSKRRELGVDAASLICVCFTSFQCSTLSLPSRSVSHSFEFVFFPGHQDWFAAVDGGSWEMNA